MARDSTNEIRSNLKAYIQSELTPLKSGLAQLQAFTLANERDQWLSKGVHSNALRTHIQYLRKVKETGSDWQFQRGLDTLQTIIKGFRDSHSTKQDVEDITQYTKFLTEIEKENPVMVASINQLLKELRQ